MNLVMFNMTESIMPRVYNILPAIYLNTKYIHIPIGLFNVLKRGMTQLQFPLFCHQFDMTMQSYRKNIDNPF